ncbi:MAG: efflux RND transporter periplasmic adaptor subunit [Bryobacteraceae bacterium]
MLRIAIPTILAFTLLTGCGGHSPRQGTAESAAPVPVKAVEVTAADWPLVYEASGTVRARTVATISSKMMGYVREVYFQTGDRVRQGQLLLELDSRDADAQLQQAESAASEAREALQEVESAIAAAKANLELAQATHRRMKDLFEKKSVSTQEFDEATARLKAAQAAYEMAAAKRRQVTARIEQAAAAVEAARVMRGYARIIAPFDGVVTEKHVEPGNLAAPGAPLAVIEQQGALRLEASVEESRLKEIRPGQSAGVRLEAVDRQIDARVSEIVPAVDPVSRSGLVKLDLPPMPQLRSGMFGRAAFALGSRKVTAVPAAAIRTQGQLRSVLVVEGGIARARLVTLGSEYQRWREVLSGLSAGEKIVSPLPAALADGARVEVQP